MRHLTAAGGRLAVIDLETTGLSNSDEIIEIAIVTLGPDGAVIDELETLVRPGRAVSPGASRVNGLVDADLTSAPTFGEVAGAVAQLLHGSCIVAHNAEFDLRMLHSAFRAVGSALSITRPIDTYRLTRLTLEQSLITHGIPAVDLHRAMGDVRATIELLRRIAEDLEPGDPLTIEPLPRTSGAALAPRPTDVRPQGTTGRSPRPVPARRREAGERVNMRRSTSGKSGGASVDMDDSSLLRAQKPVDLEVELTPGAHVVLSTLSTHSKAEVTAHATSLGLVVKPEVSKQTALLVTDDIDAPSRRARKARELKVPIALAANLLACEKGQSVPARGDAG